MAVMKWLVKGSIATGVGLVGAALAPIAWGVLTGVLAVVSAAVLGGVPAFLTIEAGVQATPVIALLGFLGAAWWVMQR